MEYDDVHHVINRDALCRLIRTYLDGTGRPYAAEDVHVLAGLVEGQAEIWLFGTVRCAVQRHIGGGPPPGGGGGVPTSHDRGGGAIPGPAAAAAPSAPSGR